MIYLELPVTAALGTASLEANAVCAEPRSAYEEDARDGAGTSYFIYYDDNH